MVILIHSFPNMVHNLRIEDSRLFSSGFSCNINHYMDETATETGNEFSVIYIFITLFVNKV